MTGVASTTVDLKDDETRTSLEVVERAKAEEKTVLETPEPEVKEEKSRSGRESQVKEKSTSRGKKELQNGVTPSPC